jgi:UDP-N-acetylglucosamine--N-acetylmuramyl-(pentapeptide) pyrophosphoryl-undecaprenol N-acetylglucosamine transferase
MLIPDNEAGKSLVARAIELASDWNRKKTLSENIVKMAQHDSDLRIAREVLKLIRND